MISVVTLSNGLELIRPGITYTEVLVQTASCTHRLLFYALEYWIEHCFQYASSSPNIHLNLVRHLDCLYEKHSRLAQLLGLPSVAKESSEEGSDKRLCFFLQTPARNLMRERLLNGQLTGKQPSRDGKGSSTLLPDLSLRLIYNTQKRRLLRCRTIARCSAG